MQQKQLTTEWHQLVLVQGLAQVLVQAQVLALAQVLKQALQQGLELKKSWLI